MDQRWTAYWNGAFVPDDQITISPSDRGFILGDAVYEATRTYRHRPFHLDWHLDRLYDSLAYLRLDPKIERPQMEALTEAVLERNRPQLRPDDDVSLVHRITRGAYRPPYSDQPPGPPTVLITCRPIAFARFADLYERGVELIIASVRVPAAGGIDPRVKTQSRLLLALGAVEASEQGRDVLPLFSDVDGHMTESSSSNVFFVFGGQVATANDEAVLGGITRRALLHLADQQHLPVERRPIHLDELSQATEAFITATSIGILPVRRLAGRDLTLPGPVTLRLTEALGRYAGVDIVKQARAHLGEALAREPRV